MGEFASKGLAGTALGFGIGGAALGVLSGGLGNLLGNLGGAPAAQAAQTAAADTTASMAAMLAAASLAGRNGGTCSENTEVNRYELNQNRTIAEKDMEIAYWRGQDETNRKISDSYSKLESKINGLAAEVRANKDEQNGINMQQAVYNGTNTAAISCMGQQVAALQSVMQGLTKIVISNDSVCPGWGTATVSVSTGTAAA